MFGLFVFCFRCFPLGCSPWIFCLFVYFERQNKKDPNISNAASHALSNITFEKKN
jgi:hypothetical protein